VRALVTAYFLVRFMTLGDGLSVFIRGEGGPFTTLQECESELVTHANQTDLVCREGL